MKIKNVLAITLASLALTLTACAKKSDDVEKTQTEASSVEQNPDVAAMENSAKLEQDQAALAASEASAENQAASTPSQAETKADNTAFDPATASLESSEKAEKEMMDRLDKQQNK